MGHAGMQVSSASVGGQGRGASRSWIRTSCSIAFISAVVSGANSEHVVWSPRSCLVAIWQADSALKSLEAQRSPHSFPSLLCSSVGEDFNSTF